MDYINASIYGAILAGAHFLAHYLGLGVPAVTLVVFIGFIVFHELAEVYPVAKA